MWCQGSGDHVRAPPPLCLRFHTVGHIRRECTDRFTAAKESFAYTTTTNGDTVSQQSVVQIELPEAHPAVQAEGQSPKLTSEQPAASATRPAVQKPVQPESRRRGRKMAPTSARTVGGATFPVGGEGHVPTPKVRRQPATPLSPDYTGLPGMLAGDSFMDSFLETQSPHSESMY
ncbi:hypothetical protein DPMN_136834 [Dreissena polymorpha]|uniref:Uncharacterized protein n=1 Tax=Dreissena polymorpha TaxID=45954 RepID=A0A9D4G0S4_DREPO|nr:hypothetical protein DPMN_136834 [Dreissena polymorpha]